ncbi:MAG TPA: twin-arginine translocation signal domain-containing protein, partial [Spirochaetota bacterium]
MALTRRDFLKLSLTAGVAGALGGVVAGVGCAIPQTLRGGKKVRTNCSLCSLGCGIIIRTKKGVPVHVEGDEDHPVNRGSVCARAFLIPSFFKNEQRLSSVQYRAKGASQWSSLSWEKAIAMIAQRIHQTRDESFLPFDGPLTVNRTEGITAVAGSSLTNEEGYLAAKFFRLIG